MDGRFLTAFVVPRKWPIGCFKLKPYNLRHMLYLTALDSPFVKKEVKPEYFDTLNVMAFLRICSSRHPEEAFGSLSLSEWAFRIRMEVDIQYFTSVVRACFNYMHECSQPPKTITKERNEVKNDKENIPFPLMMVTILTSKLHMDIDKAWETSIGQAIWLLTAFAVQEGSDTRIVTTEDEANAVGEREALIKMQEEALAKIKEEALRARK